VERLAAETLLQVKGPKELITLSGERDRGGTWRWWVDRGEKGEERREWDDWLDALLAMDEDPWEEYEPIAVHPDFRSKIWGAVLQRAADPAGLVPWFRACFPEDPVPDPRSWEEKCPLPRLAEEIRKVRDAVVLTGAGMSTESGIPDFRSSTGLWRKIDPRRVATVEAMETDPDLFRRFYGERLRNLEDVRPHAGHYVLAEWAKQGIVRAVATQNVDGLHHKAGSPEVYELHGTLRTVRCHRCGSPADLEDFLGGDACGLCGGPLRPNVVLFGELLPEEEWDRAIRAIRESSLLLVIGTSLEVYPVNQLPMLSTGRKAIINGSATEWDHRFHHVIHARIGKTLLKLDRLVKEMK
jgi:NAD-dependent deacetylase